MKVKIELAIGVINTSHATVNGVEDVPYDHVIDVEEVHEDDDSIREIVHRELQDFVEVIREDGVWTQDFSWWWPGCMLRYVHVIRWVRVTK